MRVLQVLIATAVVLAVSGGAAQGAPARASPPLVHLRWQLVARGVTDVEASDRYLAYQTAAGLTLVDQRTHATTKLPASACPPPDQLFPFLGGPWVANCANPQSREFQPQLYNIVGRQWVAVPGTTCFPCAPVAAGSQWIEILYQGCQEHCQPQVSLENIFSGEIEPDPVSPRVGYREDLDSPTGTSPLCPPLRYPAWFDTATEQLVPGSLTMLGQFALSTLGGSDLLERCHSNWHKRLKGEALGDAQMILWSAEYFGYGTSTVHGLVLPSLRRFNFTIPRRFDPRQSGLAAVALSGRTIYVLSRRGGALWAARAPRILS